MLLAFSLSPIRQQQPPSLLFLFPSLVAAAVACRCIHTAAAAHPHHLRRRPSRSRVRWSSFSSRSTSFSLSSTLPPSNNSNKRHRKNQQQRPLLPPTTDRGPLPPSLSFLPHLSRPAAFRRYRFLHLNPCLSRFSLHTNATAAGYCHGRPPPPRSHKHTSTTTTISTRRIGLILHLGSFSRPISFSLFSTCSLSFSLPKHTHTHTDASSDNPRHSCLASLAIKRPTPPHLSSFSSFFPLHLLYIYACVQCVKCGCLSK